MSIIIEHLSKQYGSQRAVNDISFKATKGEVVGFLGPNGAGKSTTMKMLMGYLTPDGGTASICGLDPVVQPIAAKKKMGYLPESNALYFDMYVREYLQFIAEIYRLPQRKKAVAEVLEQVGLTPEANKKIGQLSKGYKQRVGLAAAIIHQPEVLILDEPTSGLDPNQIVDIRHLIAELGKNKTVLFSTHIMQEVEAVCNRVIIIHQGKIVADDTLEHLKLQSSKPALLVSFEEVPEIDWLLSLPGILSVKTEENNHYLLTTNNADVLRKNLFQWSVDKQLHLTGLQTISSNLEDVFRQVTANSSD